VTKTKTKIKTTDEKTLLQCLIHCVIIILSRSTTKSSRYEYKPNRQKKINKKQKLNLTVHDTTKYDMHNYLFYFVIFLSLNFISCT